MMAQRPALWRRALAATVLSLLAITGLATPVAASTPESPIEPLTVGRRMANADGDTAGSCLTNNNGYTFMLPCNNSVSQDWGLSTGAWALLRSDSTGGCADALGVGIGDLVPIRLCRPDSFQGWIRSSGNWFELRNVATGLCLDVRGHGTGTVVQLWECTGGGNQKWKRY